MEHEQTAEPAHQLTCLLIFAKRLDRTNRQSGAVRRVETALQEQVEIDPFAAAKLQVTADNTTKPLMQPVHNLAHLMRAMMKFKKC